VSTQKDIGQPQVQLRRFLAPRPQPRTEAGCEFCNTAIVEEHSHVVNVETRKLMCACRSCYLLFTFEGSARSKFKAVPQRYISLSGPVLTDAHWEQLQIPVGVAFFFSNSRLGHMTAFYPGPTGATESLLPLETWEAIVQANPLLESLVADVEALLIYNLKPRSTFECYIVPIDACYELVGRIRRHWRGFDGGTEAHEAIETFFAYVRVRSEENESVTRSAS
jgi:hypothetical protein